MSGRHHLPIAGAAGGGLLGLALYGACRAIGGLFGSSNHKSKRQKQEVAAPIQYVDQQQSIDVVVTRVYDHPLDDPHHPFHPENQVILRQQHEAARRDYERRTAFMRTPEHQAEMGELISNFDRLVNKRLNRRK
jgi:hypothetical protein